MKFNREYKAGWARLVVGLVVLTVLGGCAAPPKRDYSDLVWPAPPDEPRIRYVAEYRGQVDFEEDHFRNALLGVDSTGVRLGKPFSVTTSKDGNLIYVTDTKLHAVVVFDLVNKMAGRLATDPLGYLVNPMGIQLDSKGRIYVADSTRNEVLVYSPDGKTERTFGKSQGIGRATGLALDEARNRIYVVDTIMHRIVVFDFDGNFVESIGERGGDPGQFNYPIDVVVNAVGNLMVVDGGNFRVQIFSPDGGFIKTFGQVGDGYGSFTRPKGISFDSDGNVYVVDAAFNNFQIFDEDGRILLFVGTLGRAPGLFWLPVGIHLDSQDRIYIADSINARVQVFQYLKAKKDVVEGNAAGDDVAAARDSDSSAEKADDLVAPVDVDAEDGISPMGGEVGSAKAEEVDTK